MSKLSLREIAQSQLDSTPVIDGQLIVCLDTGNAYRDTATAHVKIGSDLEVVSDLPLAPLAEKLYYLKPDKLYVFLGGNWTLLNDKTIDLDEAIAKLPAESSTTLNDDVEIITQDTDITQPHYYRRKLVVLWEYIKTKAQDFFAAKNHKHGKADITDFPTSMPASDVYPWAKATTKPSYTKAEVGLGKVDNTADADKTVKRATTAGTADSANSVAWGNVKDKPTTFPPEAHDHDDRYYTEAEIDGKLEKKSPTDHTHDLSELISALSIGSSTTLNDTVQIITQGTDTDNQKYYRRPLSVLWNYIKSKADSVYSAIGHNHKIQNLEEYTTRVYDATIVRPADTVLASPQDKDGLATFRKLDKNDVGLENVDNTADVNKNVATAGIATTGVRDYNNANNIIKIGWSGKELDADSLTYVAGYTSDKKIHPTSKDGVRSWLGLGDSAYKNTKSRSNKGSTDWTNNATDDAIVPTMSFMAYWDGAYNSNGASNLSYCDRGRFGTIVTKNTGDYAVAGHIHLNGAKTGAIDWNTFTTYGVYKIQNCTMDNARHAPPNEYSFGILQVLDSENNGGEKRIIQIYWPPNTAKGNHLWYRMHNSSDINAGWSGWSAIVKKPATAGYADSAGSVAWGNVSGKPSTYPPSSHTHAYLPTGGGTMSGALNFANNTWNHVGDDVQIGDHNTSGSFYVQGLNGATNIKLKKKGDTSTGSGDSATITYDGGNLIIDKTIQANLNGAAISANALNPTVTLIGGDKNTAGYRLIGQVSIGKWRNYRCVMLVNSRHQGAGLVTVTIGNNSSSITQANAYAEIKYWGPTSSGVVISSSSYQVYISSDGKTGYLFWYFWDYSQCPVYVLRSDFTISNGTWMTGIGSGYGKCVATTQINAASTAEVATTGVRDYNNANNTIKIGWSGADLDENTLAYIAGYTSDMKIHTASKAGVRSWIGLGDYLPLSGGTMTGQITKSTGGSWIGDRDSAAIKSGYAGDWSYGAVAAMATKKGYWTMGNLGCDERLIFNYSTDTNYNAGKNETSQVYLPAQAGTIITSATIGNQTVNTATYSTYVKDIGNSSNTTFAYSKAGMNYGDYTWLAGWNGYELRAINKNQFATAEQGVTASGKTGAGIYYVRFGNGTQMCWGFYNESNHSGSTSFPVAFNNSQYSLSLTVTVSSNNAPYITGRSTTGFSYARHGTSYNDVQWIAVGTWK